MIKGDMYCTRIWISDLPAKKIPYFLRVWVGGRFLGGRGRLGVSCETAQSFLGGEMRMMIIEYDGHRNYLDFI